MNVESMTEKCDGISYIEVDLGSTYYIDYVIVYAGKGMRYFTSCEVIVF